MNLYQLTQEYLSLQSLLEDPDMDPQAVEDTLEGLGGELEEKADSLACVIKDLEADALAMKKEADALAQRAKSRTARAERLREYLFQQMRLVGLRKIETSRNRISIRKTPPSLRLEDAPRFLEWARENRPDLLREKPPELDKSAVRDALKAGDPLPGAKLESGETFSLS